MLEKVANTYNRQDVFIGDKLKAVCDLHAFTRIEDGTKVLQWRESMGKKYSDLPGTRKYHDFMIVRTHEDKVVMKVREHCYCGSLTNSPLHVTDDSCQVYQ